MFPKFYADAFCIGIFLFKAPLSGELSPVRTLVTEGYISPGKYFLYPSVKMPSYLGLFASLPRLRFAYP